MYDGRYGIEIVRIIIKRALMNDPKEKRHLI